MQPVLTYYGGKQRMLKHILPLVPSHGTYVEPFAGGAALFWAKPKVAVEVLNDLNAAVYLLYRQLRDCPSALFELTATMPAGRQLYERSVQTLYSAPYFSRAAVSSALFFLSHLSFASKIGKGYGYSRVHKKTESTFCTRFAKVQTGDYTDRLVNTVILNEDARAVLWQYDSADTFHYVDPPYIDTNCGHYEGYSHTDYFALLSTLSKLRGKFLLSSFPNEHLTRYAAAGRWSVRTFELHTTASLIEAGAERRYKTEVLAWNY